MQKMLMLVNWAPIKETMQLVGRPYVKTEHGVYPVAFRDEMTTSEVRDLFFLGGDFIAETTDGTQYLLRGENNPPFMEGQDLMKQIFSSFC